MKTEQSNNPEKKAQSPLPPVVNPMVIPSFMRFLRQWVLWGVPNKPDKMPCSVVLLRGHKPQGRWNAPENLVTYDEAHSAMSEFHAKGVGFWFTDDSPVCGIDLDMCIVDGQLEEWAKNVLSPFRGKAFVEQSMSKQGLHVYFLAPSVKGISRKYEKFSPFGAFREVKGANGVVKKQMIECYSCHKYFAFTGTIAKGISSNELLDDMSQEFQEVISEYETLNAYNVKQSHNPPAPSVDSFTGNVGTENLSDRELWERMFSSKHGREIQALYNGDVSGYHGNDSRADLALCSYLAFWTGKDRVRMDNMFRQSGLMRPKWDMPHYSTGETYGEHTLQKALSNSGSIGSSGISSSGYMSEIPSPPSVDTISIYDDVPIVDNGVNPANPNVGDFSELKVPDFVGERLARALGGFDDFKQGLLRKGNADLIPTGFASLDKAISGGGLYAGLMSIGAISSLGKSSFVLQISDYIAQHGRPVLFFALEMSRDELISRSLSRLLFEADNNEKHAYLSVMRNQVDFSKIEPVYSQIASNLCIVEPVRGLRVSLTEREFEDENTRPELRFKRWSSGGITIREYVSSFRAKRGISPVVVVDYLQILSPLDERMTDKRAVDANVFELKQISRDFNVPVIVVSSFNRESYRERLSMASFKESGAIEYSADVLIGLQYEGFDDVQGRGRAEHIDQILKRNIELQKQGEPQSVELKILKNRRGFKSDLSFDFHSKCSCFCPRDESNASFNPKTDGDVFGTGDNFDDEIEDIEAYLKNHN